jgi:hypothetical protein
MKISSVDKNSTALRAVLFLNPNTPIDWGIGVSYKVNTNLKSSVAKGHAAFLLFLNLPIDWKVFLSFFLIASNNFSVKV